MSISPVREAAPPAAWRPVAADNAFIAEIDRVTAAEWTAIVDDFEDATIYQTWAYEEVRWGAHRMHHVVIRRAGHVVAAAQVRALILPVLKAGIAYLYLGPMWRPRGREADPEALRAVLRALRDEFVARRGLQLRIIPREIAEDPCPARDILEQEGFRRVNATKPYRTFLLDLSPSIDGLRKGLASDWRNRLRKSYDRDITLVHGTTDDLYGHLAGLYEAMHARKGFVRYVDVNEFREIQRRLPDHHKMRITVLYFEGDPVAASTLSAIGGRAMGILFATSDRALTCQAANRLVWDQICAAKEMGFRHLDMGGIDPVAYPGGYTFKKGVGGRDIQFIGEYRICESPASRIIIGAAMQARHAWRTFRNWQHRPRPVSRPRAPR